MSDHQPDAPDPGTHPDDHVPPEVLDELTAAFAEPPADVPADLDDTRGAMPGEPSSATVHEPAAVPPARPPGDPVGDPAGGGEVPVYDLDDPNIDALLGIAPEQVPIDAATAAAAAAAAGADVAPPPADPPDQPGVPPADPALRPAIDPGLVGAPAGAASGAGVPAGTGATAGRDPSGESGPRRIVIEETDLPDAVYLDEEAETRLRQVHGHLTEDPVTTIVIGDADTDAGRPIEQVPTTSRPTIDPRVRARRIAVGRARGRRRLWVVLAALSVLAVLVAGLAVLGSSWFEVTQVDVQGSSYSKPDVDQVLESVRGRPVLLVDTVQLEHRLEATPWVEMASVSTDFPHGLFVDIRERRPVAYYLGSDHRARAIDRDARVIAVLDGVPLDYPEITGSAPDLGPGQSAGATFAGAAEVILSLPPELRAQMDTVGADASAGVVSLRLKTGAIVRLGAPTDLTRKLARLLIVVRLPGFKKLRIIDVSTTDVSTS